MFSWDRFRLCMSLLKLYCRQTVCSVHMHNSFWHIYKSAIKYLWHHILYVYFLCLYLKYISILVIVPPLWHVLFTHRKLSSSQSGHGWQFLRPACESSRDESSKQYETISLSAGHIKDTHLCSQPVANLLLILLLTTVTKPHQKTFF